MRSTARHLREDSSGQAVTALLLTLLVGPPALHAATAENGLDRPLLRYEETRGAHGLFHFCTKVAKAPCGQELYPSPRKAPPKKPPLLDLRETSVLKVLNALVQQMPDARWEVRDGVINVEPRTRDREDLLARKVSTFSVQGVSSLQAALDVLEDAGIRSSYQETGRQRRFGIVDLDLKDVTVREALNAIVKADGKVMWIFSYSGSPESSGDGTLLFLSDRKSGGVTSAGEWKKTKRWKRKHGRDGRGKRPKK